MARIQPEQIITAIDVGTTKICVFIAHHVDGVQVELLGMGHAPSHGLKKGVVVDISKTVQSIGKAVKRAEEMAGMPITMADIGISGAHIHSLNSHGMVTIKRGSVTHEDIANVLAAARAVPIPEGQQILHVLPQYFVIDGSDRVQDPRGMHGIRLEVQAHIVMGSVASVQNLVKCCQLAGVHVKDIVLEQLASAHAVLSSGERELGVAMIDIGGGTADVALYKNGNIRHTMVLPVAGNHFTNDLAIGLRLTIPEAERVKKEYGYALDDLIDNDQLVEVELVQGNTKSIVTVQSIADILQPRAEELLHLVHEEILKYRLQPFMSSGVVLTGGGSLLRGMVQLTEQTFNKPARIGTPHSMHNVPESINNPMYATGYGLLVQAAQKKESGSLDKLEGPLVKRIFSRMKSWVADFF